MITSKKGDTRRPEHSLWELSKSVRCSDLWGSPRRWLWPRWRRPPASLPWACSGPPGPACGRPAGAESGWCCTWTRDIVTCHEELRDAWQHLDTTSLRLIRYLLCFSGWNVASNGGNSYMHWNVYRKDLIYILFCFSYLTLLVSYSL